MTDRDGEGGRQARIETTHEDNTSARHLARAVTPDNTEAMETSVEGDRVVTSIRRPTTGGLHSTLDDYIVNLAVGRQVTTRGREATADSIDSETDTTETDTNTDT